MLINWKIYVEYAGKGLVIDTRQEAKEEFYVFSKLNIIINLPHPCHQLQHFPIFDTVCFL